MNPRFIVCVCIIFLICVCVCMCDLQDLGGRVAALEPQVATLKREKTLAVNAAEAAKLRAEEAETELKKYVSSFV